MVSGIINIHKEAGMTSFDVVAAMRRIAGQKKVGHTGTLDPDAVGVLPICLGTATKVCDLLTNERKEYEAEMLLGVVTDTQDTGGRVLQTAAAVSDREAIEEAILSFAGEYDQVPPMYSAKRVGGKRLYELARKGIEVERSSCRVTIYAIEILQISLPHVVMRVVCSRGTYIRTLIHDIGQKLGCGACMSRLTRTAVGPFRLENSVYLKDVENTFARSGESEILIGTDLIFSACPAYTAGSHEKALQNGNALRPQWLIPFEKKAAVLPETVSGISSRDEGRIRMYLEDGTFAALYRFRAEEEMYRPEKMFLA